MSVRLRLNTQPRSHRMEHPRRDVFSWVESTKGSAPSEAGKEIQRDTGTEPPMGWSGPALWASGVSELRHAGAKGAYDLDACGRLVSRDERGWQALRYISRSLVSARAVHHRASRWRRTFRRVGEVQRACQDLEWREPSKRQTCLGPDCTGVDLFDITVCQSGCV